MEKVLICVLQEQDHLRLKREWQQDTSKLTVGKCILGLEAGPGGRGCRVSPCVM